MLHHVEVYVSNIDRSFEFWSRLLAKLDYSVSAKWEDGFSLAQGGIYLTFVQVQDRFKTRENHRCGVGLNHLAFKVKGREAVKALHDELKQEGVPLLYEDRYPFANGGTDYFAFYFEDPDRIKIEFVAV